MGDWNGIIAKSGSRGLSVPCVLFQSRSCSDQGKRIQNCGNCTFAANDQAKMEANLSLNGFRINSSSKDIYAPFNNHVTRLADFSDVSVVGQIRHENKRVYVTVGSLVPIN